MIRSRSVVLVVSLFLLVTTSAATGQCENSTSKWKQSPDMTSNGIDIRMDRQPFNVRRTLADDFLCTETGPITCVQFWGSWYGDTTANPFNGTLKQIHLSIHSDVPADATNTYSHPGDLLWEADFDSTSFTETLFAELCPDPLVTAEALSCARASRG